MWITQTHTPPFYPAWNREQRASSILPHHLLSAGDEPEFCPPGWWAGAVSRSKMKTPTSSIGKPRLQRIVLDWKHLLCTMRHIFCAKLGTFITRRGCVCFRWNSCQNDERNELQISWKSTIIMIITPVCCRPVFQCGRNCKISSLTSCGTNGDN